MNKYYDVAMVREAITSPVPSVNPVFTKDGEIDWDKTAGLMDFFIQTGSKAILLTFGDSNLHILSDDEIAQFNKCMADTAAGRVMTISCSGRWNHDKNIAFARFVSEAGCDIHIPFYPDWAASCDAALLAQCFRDIGKIMPVMLLTAIEGRGIPFPTIEALTPADGIVAVKDDVPMPYGRDLGYRIRDKFAFLSGGTASGFLAEVPYGADGYLSVYARCFPQISDEFWKTYKTGTLLQAAKVVEKYELPLRDLWNSMHFDAVNHALQELAGVGTRYRRAPYSSLTDEQMEKLKELIKSFGVI